MAITQLEQNQIIDEVVKKIKDSSQDVAELEEVTTLDGVTSLPAMKGQQVVAAPLSLLGAVARDAVASIVSFTRIFSERLFPNILDGSDSLTVTGEEVYHEPTKRFYLAVKRVTTMAGNPIVSWLFYKKWSNVGLFVDENGNVRTDCLFTTHDGRLYRFDGENLISAGFTEEQATTLIDTASAVTALRTDTATALSQKVSEATMNAALITKADLPMVTPIADWQSKIKNPNRFLLTNGCSVLHNWSNVKIGHACINSETGSSSSEQIVINPAKPYSVNADGTTVGNAGVMTVDQANALRDVVADVATLKTDMPKKAQASTLANYVSKDQLTQDLAPLATKSEQTAAVEAARTDLFRKLWLAAVGSHGSYNAANPAAPYRLNGLDLTEAEAVLVYDNQRDLGSTAAFSNLKARTFIPSDIACGMCFPNLSCAWYACSKLEVLRAVRLPVLYSTYFSFTFLGCIKLREIIDPLGFNDISTEVKCIEAFSKCYSLEKVKILYLKTNLSFADCPKLTSDSLTFTVANATNTNPITITVHPEVYAKLTDTANTEWYKVLTDAAAKQITFATV